MKIAIHTNELCGRGTGKTPYDYALGLRHVLGHEVVFFTSGLSANESLPRIAKEFPVFTYDALADRTPAPVTREAIERLVAARGIEFVHFLKYGHDDGLTPRNCRSGVHCVFIMGQPHGDVYAAVSEALARKFQRRLFVPHIIKAFPPSRDLRRELGLPADALVIGRHGGAGTFDIPFAQEAVRRAVDARRDLHFVFLSTRPFCEHERVRFLPWVETEQEKFDVIHACDAMLHARLEGETFGIAVAEFSAANKPVITWTGRGHAGYDRAHLDLLGTKALLYHNQADLLNILLRLDRKFVTGRQWDVYTQRFSEAAVIRQYHDVFLAGQAARAPVSAAA